MRSNVTSSGDIHTKAVYLNGLYHTLSNDTDHTSFVKSIPVSSLNAATYIELGLSVMNPGYSKHRP